MMENAETLQYQHLAGVLYNIKQEIDNRWNHITDAIVTFMTPE